MLINKTLPVNGDGEKINSLFSSIFSAEPLPLMDLCRRSIRFALGRDRLHDIEILPLPLSLKNYLQYQ